MWDGVVPEDARCGDFAVELELPFASEQAAPPEFSQEELGGDENDVQLAADADLEGSRAAPIVQKRRRLTIDWERKATNPLPKGAWAQYSRARDAWVAQWVRSRPQGFWPTGTLYKQKKSDGNTAVMLLDSKQKQEMLAAYLKAPKTGARPATQRADDARAAETGENHNGVVGYLLTYNTRHGLSDGAWTDLCARIARADVESPDFEELVALASRQPVCAQLLNELQPWLRAKMEEHKFTEHSLQMELSLQSEDRGRFHVHIFLSRMKLMAPSQLFFLCLLV
jgi:hypothetical protein